ncbi:MAG: hypothetical protein V3V56_07330 [bacterium]
MGAGKFRGNTGRLSRQIEEMAHVVYGLPINEQSRKVADSTASFMLTLSRVEFEREEEPLLPRPPGADRPSGPDRPAAADTGGAHDD